MAVIVFYKCRLCENGRTCTRHKKDDCNKRFDPKRLRFIMLLRDDILDFCKRHFDNDSLRAFVEKEKKDMLLASTKHMYSDYRGAKDVYIEYLKAYTDLINNRIEKSDLNIESYKEDVGEIEKFIDFLINKRELMDKFNNIEIEKQDEFSVSKFVDIIKQNYLYILSFYFKTPGLNNTYNQGGNCVELNCNIGSEDNTSSK